MERRTEVFRVLDAVAELMALVEGARGLPMSGSCVVPRGLALDLIDEVRACLPAELDDAQAVISAQDDLLVQARQRLEQADNRARAALDQALGKARAESERMRGAALTESERLIADARAEHQRLVTATEVYQAAANQAEQLVGNAREQAGRLVAEATERAAQVEAEARDEARLLLTEARAEATRLREDADEYVEDRLRGFAETLERMVRSVEKGRQALRERSPEPHDKEPAGTAQTGRAPGAEPPRVAMRPPRDRPKEQPAARRGSL